MPIDQFTAVVIICGVVLVWWLTGLAYNKRLLGSYWRTLKRELLEMNGTPKLREVRPTSITLAAGSLGKNITNALISVVLIGRQNPFSYSVERAQKRFDTMSLRGDLRTKPSFELELLNRNYQLTPSLLSRPFKDWGQEDLRGTQMVYCWKYGHLPFTSEVEKVADLWRISIRKDKPNILVALRARNPQSEELLQWVRKLDEFMTDLMYLSDTRQRR